MWPKLGTPCASVCSLSENTTTLSARIRLPLCGRILLLINIAAIVYKRNSVESYCWIKVAAILHVLPLVLFCITIITITIVITIITIIIIIITVDILRGGQGIKV